MPFVVVCKRKRHSRRLCRTRRGSQDSGGAIRKGQRLNLRCSWDLEKKAPFLVVGKRTANRRGIEWDEPYETTRVSLPFLDVVLSAHSRSVRDVDGGSSAVKSTARRW